MFLQQFELSIMVNGRPVKEYVHNGNTFVEGKVNSEFEIQVRSNYYEDVLVVISVDGKSIISGEDCSLQTSGGYIVPAMSFIKIPGWRLNNNQIAKFVYSDVYNAYATQLAKNAEAPINLGVIGCAFFKRQPFHTTIIKYPHITPNTPMPKDWGFPVSPPWDSAPFWYKTTTDAAPYSVHYNAQGTPSNDNVASDHCNSIGTGFGQAQTHNVTQQAFNREETPTAILTLYYDSREGLKAKGVSLTPVIAVVPQAFPASTKQEAGCAPPKNWTGK